MIREIKCTFCGRVLISILLSGWRRFFCWLLGHRISRFEFEQSGIPNPFEPGTYCYAERTCKFCRKVISEGKFA